MYCKTPLPVGGANTACCPSTGEMASRPPRRISSLGASEAGSVGVANNRSDCGIPTKPAGGLLSDIGDDDPCLRLTGRTLPDRPEMV